MAWTGFWAGLFTGYFSNESPLFSLSLILLFTLLVKNMFWFYRYNKLVIKAIQVQGDELEALTEESENEDQN